MLTLHEFTHRVEESRHGVPDTRNVSILSYFQGLVFPGHVLASLPPASLGRRCGLQFASVPPPQEGLWGHRQWEGGDMIFRLALTPSLQTPSPGLLRATARKSEKAELLAGTISCSSQVSAGVGRAVGVHGRTSEGSPQLLGAGSGQRCPISHLSPPRSDVPGSCVTSDCRALRHVTIT